MLLAVVAVVLRIFKPQELHTLLAKDAQLRQILGFVRVPHRRTLERRLGATLPEAEAQVQALGQQILAEVEPGPNEPQAAAIDGRMYQAQGPFGHARNREHGRVPPTLRNGDTDSAWSKSGHRGWGQGYRLVLQGLVFPAPVPLFACWCPNSVGEGTILAQALETHQLPVTELLLGDSTFGSADLVAAYGTQGGWLLMPNSCPPLPPRGNVTSMLIDGRPSNCSFSALSKPVTSKPAPPKGWLAVGPLFSPVCGCTKPSISSTIVTIDRPLISKSLLMKPGGASQPELRVGFN